MPRVMLLCVLCLSLSAGVVSAEEKVSVDLTHYAKECGVMVRRDGEKLTVRWPMGEAGAKEWGSLTLDLGGGKALIESAGIAADAKADAVALLHRVEPVTYFTVGSREAPRDQPPHLGVWQVFFDKPANRPHRTHMSRLDLKKVSVASEGRRATIAIDELTIGPFTGELDLTFYAGTRLIHVEAVVSTKEDRRAILYDTGLIGDAGGWKQIAWMNTEGRMQRSPAGTEAEDRALAVAHRMLIAECDRGSVACFPPPHQYQFPRDWTDNLKFTWMGKGHLGLTPPFGFGVRQEPDGKRPFEPWFNAPPDTRQRLGVFYLLSAGKAEDTLKEMLRFTHGD